MDLAEVASLAVDNFRVHATEPSRGITEARIEESRSLTWVDAGLDVDTFNIVLGARLEDGSVAIRAPEVAAHFARVGRPFSWWVSPGDRPEDLGERLTCEGLTSDEWELAMACPVEELRDAASVPGLSIARATTARSLDDFARLNAENWTPPDAMVDRYYARAAGRLLRPDAPLRYYVARVEGAPIAAVEIAVSRGAVGAYNVSTRAPHRGRGVGGTRIVSALRDVAREDRADWAVLQARPAASGLYRRLGFAEFGRIAEFKPMPNVR